VSRVPIGGGWGRRAGTVVGVDAGGTGSRAVVVRDGVLVERRELGPLNVLLHADAVDRLAELLTGVGASAAGMGLAGIRSAGPAVSLGAELTTRSGATVAVGDDTDAALAGAFRGGPGIVLIAGTGSGAAGRDAAGRTARVGGHGFLLGDEGGGYWIGREAVRAALRAADGTGPTTALTAVVEDVFGSLPDAERLVHASPTDRTLLAGLLPAVAAAAPSAPGPSARVAAGTTRAAGSTVAAGTPAAAGGRAGGIAEAIDTSRAADAHAAGEGASGITEAIDTSRAADAEAAERASGARAGEAGDEAGDEEAGRILAEAAGHLADLADAVRARLGPLPVAITGGVFRCAPIRDAVVARTGAVDPAEPPEIGAIRLLDRH
jgi:N-acetylglucosamine kinase-like BadF-type ATPase